MDHRYDSYLIRVYRSGSTGRVFRAVLEEIQSGREVELRREDAAPLVAVLEAVLHPPAARWPCGEAAKR